mmetsp:Transcript_78912/g.226116  ORF Transcript_78912/g.226116 Transcript_78912/m.226116 type:complete len:216 (+) Transcript_78912:353-1000(+)
MKPVIHHLQHVLFQSVHLRQRKASDLAVEGVLVEHIVLELRTEHHATQNDTVAGQMADDDVRMLLGHAVNIDQGQDEAFDAAVEKLPNPHHVLADADAGRPHAVELREGLRSALRRLRAGDKALHNCGEALDDPVVDLSDQGLGLEDQIYRELLLHNGQLRRPLHLRNCLGCLGGTADLGVLCRGLPQGAAAVRALFVASAGGQAGPATAASDLS